MNDDSHYPEKLRALLELFDGVTEMEERMALLVSYAERFKPIPGSVASRPYPVSHRVPLCESEAYVWAFPGEGETLKFHFAVENPSGVSAKALAGILDKTLSGESPEKVAAVSPDIVNRIFRQNISMGKGMGLMGMVQMVRSFAVSHMKAKTTAG